MNQRPLDGIRVIEMGSLIAGPFAGKTLGDFGADVIKIEPPRQGDPLRSWRTEDGETSMRSEEHTSELQSLMRISYAVFCLNKKNTYQMTRDQNKHKQTTRHKSR